jgi:hypothetical protein
MLVVNVSDSTALATSTISGTLTNVSGAGVSESVSVYMVSGNYHIPAGNFTGSGGNYSVSGLPAGSYKVQIGNGASYNHVWYPSSINSKIADTIVLDGTNSFTANEILTSATNGSITGKTNLPNVLVSLRDGSDLSTAAPIAWVYTDAGGHYTLRGIRYNENYLHFNGSPTGCQSGWYNGNSPYNVTAMPNIWVISSTAANSVLNCSAGAISGKVSNVSGTGIGSVQVIIWDYATENWIASVLTASDGTYTVKGLLPGTYKVFVDGSAKEYNRAFYNNVSSSGAATSVAVPLPYLTTPDINVTLAAAGSISGTVVNASTGVGIPNVTVKPYDAVTGLLMTNAFVTTSPQGKYVLSGLAAGNYKVQFSTGTAGSAGTAGSTGYANQFYNNSANNISVAVPVSVTAGSTTSGINAALVQGGNISGTVKNLSGVGVSGISVRAWDIATGVQVDSYTTGTAGTYTMYGLRAGAYRVQFFSDTTGYVGQYYNNKEGYNSSLADSVTVAVGSIVSGVNAILTLGSTISGRVIDSNGIGISGISINLNYSAGAAYISAITDATGNYSLPGVQSGSYKIIFNPDGSGVGKYFARRVYGSAGGALDFNHASIITVTAPTAVTGINITLPPAGAISGTVTNSSGTGVSGVLVVPYYSTTTTEAWNMRVTTDPSGSYTIGGLDPGNYVIRFNDTQTLEGIFYSAKTTPFVADQVIVSAGTTTSAVNSSLTPPTLPVTINFAGIEHLNTFDGTEYDQLLVGINSYSTSMAGFTLMVSGPGGYNYIFTDSDRIFDQTRQLVLLKKYQTNGTTPTPRMPGLYTFTLFDSLGNEDIKYDTHVTAVAPIPLIDTTTIKNQRNADGSYRFSWKPVSSAGTYYYRLLLFLNDGYISPVYSTDRNANPFADVPAGTKIDRLTYKVRVDVFDASLYDQITNESNSAFVDFTPQISDYTPVNLKISGTGSGTVNSNPSGIACASGSACPPFSFSPGSLVNLMATPSAGSFFGG